MTIDPPGGRDYVGLVEGVSSLLESARRGAARAVNTIMTATYWEIGRRIVEFEQGGETRAEYGSELLERLAEDLTRRFGRGFSARNLLHMRKLYATFPTGEISQTLSAKSVRRAPPSFPLPWSHYVLLLGRTRSTEALGFYHAEALRGGWSVRQLERQINSLFYERTAPSRNKSAVIDRGAESRPGEELNVEQELKDPLVLEFLGLKDEYSESDLEEALVRHLESFLLELGGGFASIGRQRRLRIANAWFRIDLLFFHRRLRCLVVIDLKEGEFTPADAGQMNTYLHHAREHWTHPGENPPVGLVLVSAKDEALAHHALGGLENSVLAREYRLVLPEARTLATEIEKTRKRLGR